MANVWTDPEMGPGKHSSGFSARAGRCLAGA
jgi:hypothetical protein